ncbi:GIY-YIG nuclease family protein [Sphingopyxis granuli]|uniref:GIY-YIG nuclease family protein n=1 Tax=Sphingopyxis granuli TaxID=267128 RepID=UPI00082F5E8B|nr:GIY-YIG nuclease family protein [Sphingopyxis granuli]
MIIRSKVDLATALRQREEKHYVYILRYPDDVIACDGEGTPFYVGIGQNDRLFSHEENALHKGEISEKADAIREIQASGREVVRTIDSFHFVEPFIREAELILEIGRKAEGTGPLLNAQTYSPSHRLEGVELRKYAVNQIAAGGIDAIPARFKLRNVRLMGGPNIPRSIQKNGSKICVMGKVYQAAQANPGITGEQLVHALAKLDWSENKSAYTQGGQVCASWLCGYIEGAFFRSDKLHLQEFRP